MLLVINVRNGINIPSNEIQNNNEKFIMTELTQQDHGITSIITAIKTPLGFFVLVLLVGETCFVLIVKDLEGIDRTIAIIGMITMMLSPV